MIIAFTGFKGSGKTAAAEYLISAHGFERVSFAEPLKRSAAASLGTNVKFLEAAKNDPAVRVQLVVREGGTVHGDGRIVDSVDDLIVSDLSIREYLQHYGTESHRDIFGEDFWVDAAMDQLQRVIAQAGILRQQAKIVIDDCRFPNEARALLARGAAIIRIDRPGVEGTADTHVSERPLDTVTGVVKNDGSLEQLYRAVDCLL